MKKKLILFLIRLARLFGKTYQLMPELRSVSEVRPKHLYTHFGRILLAKQNPECVKYVLTYTQGQFKGLRKTVTVRTHFEDYKAISDQELDSVSEASIEGSPCSRCACEQLNIPCYCRFHDGERTGYFELIYEPHQYSDNTTF